MEYEGFIGSLVIIFIVPAIAFEPKRAEAPPFTISILSIILTGICSRPYTPPKDDIMALESIRICEYGPSIPLILT